MLKRTGLAVIQILAVALILEILFRGFYFFNDGYKFRSTDEVLAGQHPFYTAGGITNSVLHKWNQIKPGNCLLADERQTHPYLGYITHPLPPCGRSEINNRGMMGPDYPLKKENGTFVIMIAGGSVAESLTWPTTERSNKIQEELNAHYTDAKIKKFVVLSAAVGGWRQPKQFIQYALTSPVLDGVVTYDGFNEKDNIFADQKLEDTTAGEILGQVSNQMDFRRVFCAYSEMQIYRWFESGPWLRHSKALFFAAQGIRHRLQACVKSKSAGEFNPFSLPAGLAHESLTQHNLEQYAGYIRMMNSISKVDGAKVLHILQPAPAIGKNLTAEEARAAGSLRYKNNYLRLTDFIMKLNQEKIRVVNFADIFKDTREATYIDEIHYSQLGLDIARAKLIEAIASNWNLKRH